MGFNLLRKRKRNYGIYLKACEEANKLRTDKSLELKHQHQLKLSEIRGIHIYIYSVLCSGRSISMIVIGSPRSNSNWTKGKRTGSQLHFATLLISFT